MDQLTVKIEDKTGMLATVLDLISRDNINIIGISTERGPINEIRLLLDDPITAQEHLENAGLISHIIDVLGFKLSNTPGELAKISTTLSENDISIEYLYGYGSQNGKGLLAMHTSIESIKVRELLSSFQID
ncbi:MAG: hypothetical protein GPJ54_12485 [Candidatus Heimdallarchaeota archaeon]|nr:hypothetical protein [Candidatus Heimdallarchaeota archaeon]